MSNPVSFNNEYKAHLREFHGWMMSGLNASLERGLSSHKDIIGRASKAADEFGDNVLSRTYSRS